jgi:hypothetical protein
MPQNYGFLPKDLLKLKFSDQSTMYQRLKAFGDRGIAMGYGAERVGLLIAKESRNVLLLCSLTRKCGFEHRQ